MKNKLSIFELKRITGGKKKSAYLKRCSTAGYYIGKATGKVIGVIGWLFK